MEVNKEQNVRNNPIITLKFVDMDKLSKFDSFIKDLENHLLENEEQVMLVAGSGQSIGLYSKPVNNCDCNSNNCKCYTNDCDCSS